MIETGKALVQEAKGLGRDAKTVGVNRSGVRKGNTYRVRMYWVVLMVEGLMSGRRRR